MSDEHIIVDGYNVIFRSPRWREMAQSNLERARDDLLRVLAEALGGQGKRVTVVFDSREHMVGVPSRHRHVRVLFATETADVRIQALVEDERRRSGGRKRLAVRVVTSDAEVAGRARLWGAKAVSVEVFVQALGASGSPPPSGSPRQASPGGERRPGASPPGDDPGESEHPALPRGRELNAWESLFRNRSEDDQE
jgi:predicted RNA-binding protein with PIN domain